MIQPASGVGAPSTTELLQMAAEAGSQTLREIGVPSNSFPDFFFKTLEHPRAGPAVARIVNSVAVVPGKHNEFATEIVVEMYRHARWAHYGLNVFDLTESLTAGLLLTEPSKEPLAGAEDLGFPFPVLVFRIPQNYIPLFKDDGMMWADCVRAEWYFDSLGKPMVWWGAQCSGLATWRRAPLAEMHISVDYGYVHVLESDPGFVPEDNITIDATWRLISNFCAWINSRGGLDKSGQRTDKGRISKARREHKGAWPVHWIVGRDVKLSRELRESVADLVLSRSGKQNRAGWRVRTQHVVRGHWRNQAHGVGRAERRRMWIQPFMRGPEGAEAWAHMYKGDVRGDAKEAT